VPESVEWVPAFPGQRPPFAPGHELSTKHGAYSPRRVDPLAAELVDTLLADPDLAYLTAPSYRPAVLAWARAEAQVQLLDEHLAELGTSPDFGDKRVAAAYTAHHRAETRADNARRRLGLDPLSRARLGRDITQGAVQADLARLLSDERERRDALDAGSRPSSHPTPDRASQPVR